jgi:hypothetical protein
MKVRTIALLISAMLLISVPVAVVFQGDRAGGEVSIIKLDALSESDLKDALDRAASTPGDDTIELPTDGSVWNELILSDTLIFDPGTGHGSVTIVGDGNGLAIISCADPVVIEVKSGSLVLNVAVLGTSFRDDSNRSLVSVTGGIFDGDSAIYLRSLYHGYYSAEYRLSGTEWLYMAAMRASEVALLDEKRLTGHTSVSGDFIDAEKTGVGDRGLCWAGTASNMLTYTGWAAKAGCSDEDAAFSIFRSSFDDVGGNPAYGAEWFISGQYPLFGDGINAMPNSGSTGGLVGLKDASALITNCGCEYTDMIGAVDRTMHRGNAAGVIVTWLDSKYEDDGNHVMTAWGYCYDSSVERSDKGYYTGIVLSDSDDSMGVSACENRVFVYGAYWDNGSGTYILFSSPLGGLAKLIFASTLAHCPDDGL